MAKQLGIGMIEMYTEIVREEFAPIMASLNARRSVEIANTEVEARKELGIYNLTVKKLKLKAELDEVTRQLKSYEDSTYTKLPNGTYRTQSRIDLLVNAKMAERKNGLLKEAESVQNELIKRIKLSGVTSDVKLVFEDLAKQIEPLNKKLKKLPKVKTLKSPLLKNK